MFLRKKREKSLHLSSRRGVTLLEVTFAMGIFALAATSALKNYIDIGGVIALQESRKEAFSQLLSVSEEIQARGDGQITSVDWIAWLQNSLNVQTLPGATISAVVQDSIPTDPNSPDIYTLTMTFNHISGRPYSVRLTDGWM